MKKEFAEACVLKEGIIIDSAPYYSTGLGVGTEPMSRTYLPVHSKLIAVGDKFDFNDVGNLPPVIDVSRCSNVNLSDSCLAQVKPLAFAENAQVSMDGVTHLHPETDFSKCRSVTLNRAEFDDYDNPFPKALRFKSGTDVSLRNASNLPEHLNVSACR